MRKKNSSVRTSQKWWAKKRKKKKEEEAGEERGKEGKDKKSRARLQINFDCSTRSAC